MQRTIGAIAIFLIMIAGILFSSSFVAFRHYYGYTGYCSKVDLPFMVGVIFSESLATFAMLALYVYEENFNKYKEHSHFHQYYISAFLANLGLMTLLICLYPILIEKIAFLSAESTGRLNVHPLTYIATVQSVIIIWWNFRFGMKSFVTTIRYQMNYAIVTLLLISIFFVVGLATYEECFG